MFDFEGNKPSRQSSRRIEIPLKISDDHERKVIDNLVDTVDELRIFSTPTSEGRVAENIPIHQEDQRLPQRYSLLNMLQTNLHTGQYKTKLTLPGHTLTLEGWRPEAAGIWRLHYGQEEVLPKDHTDIVKYLSSILPKCPAIDSLADSINISDATMLEALWKDLKPLSDNRKETSHYNADIDRYVPSLTTDHFRKKDLEKPLDDGPYMSSTGATLSHIETPLKNIYQSRVGTQLPVDLSIFENKDNNRKPSDIQQEYEFNVEFLKSDDRIRTSLAKVAFESSTLTSSGLHDVVDLAMLYHREITSVYTNITGLVKAEHLGSSDFLSE